MNSLIPDILTSVRSIAVAGISDKPYRASNRVAHYLLTAGYEIIPINPGLDSVFGLKAYPDVASVPDDRSIDLLLVFRKSEFAAELVKSAIDARPLKYVWLQDGVISEDAAALCRETGIPLVMDDCIMRRHMQLGFPSVSS